MAEKQQKWPCTGNLSAWVTIDPGKMLKIRDLHEGPEIAAKWNVDISANVVLVKWVKCYGSEYHPGLVVCIEMPVFSKISSIIVKD